MQGAGLPDSGPSSKGPFGPAIILKDYIETLIRFSHIYHSDDLNNTLLSETCVFVKSSSSGKANKIHIPRTGDRVKGLQLPVLTLRFNL